LTEKSPIKFGTDGWRGIIAADFTEQNVRLAAEAIAGYVSRQPGRDGGLCVGYDTRFLSRRFAEIVAETASAAGIPVLLADRVTPTPALSFAVKHRGAAGGVMITSSHNPYNWNGVKYKAFYGGSGSPAIMKAVEGFLGQELPAAAEPGAIAEVNFLPPYVKAISAFADLPRIAAAKQKYAIDCMYGAGRGVLAGIFSSVGIEHIEIRSELNPLFPGIQPEPIPPHIRALEEAVVTHECHAGFATDGDADRIGAVDERGHFIDANKIYCLLMEWLLKRKQWPGAIARAFNTTKMIDRIAARYGRTVYEHGIGFKHVCELMLEKEILIGGEESGSIGIGRHLPERDGLLNALLLANLMAEEGQSLGSLVEGLQREYGEHYYGRLDLHIAEAAKQTAVRRASAGFSRFAGMRVLRQETLDGMKFYLEDPAAAGTPQAAESWILFRASGTEPLLRIYAESGSRDSLETLLEAGREFAVAGKI
jgi:phosphomannomutase